MKQRICQIMMLLFVCMTGKAYDFAYDSGHGNLVYNIIDNATTTDVVEVEVTHIANVVERSYIDIIKGDENVNYVTGNITIPSQFMKNGNLYRVVRISDDAFLNCYNLTSVTIPNSVTSIGDYAFFNCTGLTAMEIPDGVTAIGEFAFCKCSNLTSVTIPNSVTSIGGEAFSRTGLINVTIPGSVNFIYWGAFMQCYSLKRAVIEDGVTYIQGNTFAWCGNLEEVVFPSTLSQSIINNVKWGKMYNVLGGTSRLTHVVMPIDNPLSKHAEIFNGEDLNHSVLFTIPEGSAKNYLQKGYYNISDNSELAWMAEEFESEATRVAALTTAESIIASEEAKTALQTAITTARSAVEEADSYLAIGAQIDAVKTAAKTFLGTATIAAETDVTAILRNPQFDRMDMGWDVNVGTTWQGCSLGYMNVNGINEHTNGEVSIHDFLEAWWNGAALGDGRLAQTIPNLPAGRYRLECDAIASWQDDANVEVTGVNLFAGTEMTPVATENGKPEHFTVSFENSETQDVTIGIQLINTTANWVAMDNVRLYVDENIIEFADAEVKRICVKNWDTNKDGELSTAEAATVTSLGNVFMQNTDITSFDELQFFTGLTAIGGYAFIECSGLTSITIPNSVTSIDDGAFDGCSRLTSVTIPNSVTSIVGGAFWNCHGLTSVTIGSGVTSIDAFAFMGCGGLESISVNASNPKYEDCSGSNVIVEKSTRTLILGCKGTEEIPNSVTSIGDGAFACSGLTSVTIPNSVTSIGSYAFDYCI